MTKKALTVGSLRQDRQLPSAPVPRVTETKKQAPQPSQTEPTVFFQQNYKRFAVVPFRGRTLLESALAQQLEVSYKCKKGSCGVCAVNVLEGASLLCSPNDRERETLKQGIHEGRRLACQAAFCLT